MDMKKWDFEALPDELRIEIGKSIWKQNTIGQSGAYMYMLSDEQVQNRYLKIMPRKLKMILTTSAMEGKQLICFKSY